MNAARGSRGSVLWRALQTPWMATGKGQRRIAGAIYFSAVVGLALWMAFAGAAHAWMAIRVATVGVLIASALTVPFCTVLARAGRQAGWPGVQRSAALGAWICLVAGIALPGILVAVARPQLAALTVAMVAFGASMGLIYMLLPRKLGGAGALVIILLLNPGLDLSAHLAAPWLAAAVAGVALITALASMVIWRHMVRSDRWDCPLTMSRQALAARDARSAHRRRGWSAWNALMDAMLRPYGKWRDRFTAKFDLVHTGPRWPVRSMRIVLGGSDAPLTLGARLVMLCWVLAALVLVAMFLVFANVYFPRDLAWQARRVVGLGAIGLAEVLCAGCVLTTIGRSRQRRADLAMLAHLPGLGSAAQARRRMLLAIVGTPASIQACCWIGMLLVGAWLGLDWRSHALMTAIAVGSVMATGNDVLHLLAGFRRGRALAWAMFGGFVPLVASIVLSLDTRADHGAAVVADVAIAIWVACCVMLAWSAWRGWKHFRQRPHPFLLDPR